MAAAKKTTAMRTVDDAPNTLVSATKTPTKASVVVALLQRENGATSTEIIEATGWQAHTTRAMLTGLRKKGHAIARRKRDDVTCYYLPVTDA